MSENENSFSREKAQKNSLAYSDEKTSNVETSKTKSKRSMKTVNKHKIDKCNLLVPPNNRTLSRLDVQRAGSHKYNKSINNREK